MNLDYLISDENLYAVFLQFLIEKSRYDKKWLSFFDDKSYKK